LFWLYINAVRRTPTPFKNALAEIEKKSGQIKLELSSPSILVEDITEIMKREESNSSMQLNDSQLSSISEADTTTVIDSIKNEPVRISWERLKECFIKRLVVIDVFSQMQYDSGISSLKRSSTDMSRNANAANQSSVGKENTIPSGGHKRARKVLAHLWNTSTPHSSDSLATHLLGSDQKPGGLFAIETPVRPYLSHERI
jgi:hypothetical protein